MSITAVVEIAGQSSESTVRKFRRVQLEGNRQAKLDSSPAGRFQRSLFGLSL